MSADFADIDATLIQAWFQVACVGLVCGALFYSIVSWLVGRFGSRLSKASSTTSRPAGPQWESSWAIGSKGEKRTALRREGNPVAVELTDEKMLGAPFDGFVIDRSVGGLGVVIDRTVEVGTILSVRPRNAPETVPWVQIEIRSCRAENKEYLLGCRFVRTPSWSVLLHFG